MEINNLDISERLKSILINAGYETLDDLCLLYPYEFRIFKGVGEKRYKEYIMLYDDLKLLERRQKIISMHHSMEIIELREFKIKINSIIDELIDKYLRK